jgi:hypothetical protein
MKKLVPFTLAALLLSSTAVLAQSQTAFDGLDGDGDDKLSFTDLQGQWPDLTQDQFDAADLNSDDFLDLTEFEGLGVNDVDVAASGTVAPAVDFPAFESLDLDGDEKLGIDDLTGIGVTQEQFDAADIDNDDFVDRSQFEALRANFGTMMAEPANTAVGLAQPAGDRPALTELDGDGDGKLDFADLKAQWPNLTQEQFDAADIDNDDFLDESQYQSLAI